MSQGSTTRTRVYRFADLTLDSGQRVVRRGSKPIPLTGKSFALLETLVEEAPDSLSTDRLMERVWPGVVVSSGTVAKRVELLRQALGDDCNAPRYIALVRGYGYRLIPEVTGADREDSRRGRSRYVVATVALVLIAGAIAWLVPEPGRPPPEKSIAVLVFDALSTDPEDQFLADGLTDELRHLLASYGTLKVAGRTSSLHFRNSRQDAQTIGRVLGVAHLLEGSVRRRDEQVSITVQLTSTADGFSLWSKSFDRAMTDIIAIQQDIARNVAGRLGVSLQENDIDPTAYAAAISPEAYAMYLRAISLSPYGKVRNLGEAQRLIEEVTRLAPDFAPGWNRLAAIHGRRLYGRDPGYPYSMDEAMPIMLGAVAKALTIDPHSAEAYAGLGGAAWVFEGDARKAAPLIERAVELAPWDLDIISFAAEFAKYIGRLEEALELEELLVQRDPICKECRLRLAKSYMFNGRFLDAERELSTLRSIYGTGFWWEHGVAMLMTGRPAGAMELFSRLGVRDPLRAQGQAMALCDLGREEQSRAALAALETAWGSDHPQVTAQAYAYCGMQDQAFEWLERSLPEMTVKLQVQYPEPVYDRLRDDRRWVDMMIRIGRSEEQVDAIPFSLEGARARLQGQAEARGSE